jgi:nucleoside-diphosphate-sugar epimerase
MNTVLILGANGRFGQAATQAFAAAGWRVLAQVRRAATAPLPAAAQACAIPLADSVALAAQAAGARVVVHAVNPIYTRWDQEALPALQQGLDVAQRLGALFMLPGNVYNFGTQLPPLLQETTPELPDTRKAELRVAMEQAMRQRAGQGLRSVVIRAGDFFGCGTGSWLDQAIVKDIAKGRLVYPGPLDLPHAWAYLPDLARAFVAVAETEAADAAAGQAKLAKAPAFQTLHFAGHTLTGRELLAGLDDAAAALGLRPARGFTTGGMPWGLIRAVGLVHPLWRELARMSYLWHRPHALDGSVLERAVGLPPATPLQQALTQSLLDLGLGRQPARPDVAVVARPAS